MRGGGPFQKALHMRNDPPGGGPFQGGEMYCLVIVGRKIYPAIA
jgi:hypothetical protein